MRSLNYESQLTNKAGAGGPVGCEALKLHTVSSHHLNGVKEARPASLYHNMQGMKSALAGCSPTTPASGSLVLVAGCLP